MTITVDYIPTYFEVDVEQQGVAIDYDCEGYCELCREPDIDDEHVALRQQITWRPE